MRKIHIRIGNDGQVTMRVEGGTDETCLDLTRDFERAVGEVQEREMCPEPDPLCVRPDVREQIQGF